jgi:hypothetical protein
VIQVGLDTYEPPASIGALDVRIADASQRSVWSTVVSGQEVVRALTGGEPITVLVPAASIPDGRYVVTVARAGAPTQAPLLQRAFEVVRSDVP